ncbi:CHRD domain-containing protein [Noviherbaspirillum sp. UKPF54]|uniref:CHRD domain-containing protein n=1 Tax=Noviherbaspirillum sp. UKPF54 TaxID=2601898 RepID=UPI0011B13961|nr:CHRD domain-containing protein [Noviherbaspirillum sp. UKPF54]QDZ29477.1 CHRD domain-containing protein [Noviherbaspirillum sp. UKPF54]
MHSFAVRLLAPLALTLPLLASCGGGHDDVPFAFSTTLTSAEEVPPVSSAGTGAGVVTVDSSGRTLRASIVVTGIGDTQAWIQDGFGGVNGPVVFALNKEAASGAWTVRADISDAQLRALRDGRYYFNVGTVVHPAGELRGQLFEQLPSSQQFQLLEQARAQSVLIEQQLRQIQEIEDAQDFPHSGVGIGLTVGF